MSRRSVWCVTVLDILHSSVGIVVKKVAIDVEVIIVLRIVMKNFRSQMRQKVEVGQEEEIRDLREKKDTQLQRGREPGECEVVRASRTKPQIKGGEDVTGCMLFLVHVKKLFVCLRRAVFHTVAILC